MATTQKWDDFSERKLTRNLGLVVEDRTFWVMTQLLAELSPVFLKMFYGDFHRSDGYQVFLLERKAEDILELLRVLIPTDGYLKKVDTDNVVSLIKLADDYQIRFLGRQCDHVLGSLAEGHSVIKDLFVVGVDYGLKKVVRACLPMLARFDGKELQPILDSSPMEVKSAIYCQIISQSSGKMETYEYGHLGGKYVTNRCPCPTCKKPMIWEKNTHVSDQICCRCLAPRAAAELEKIGL